MLSGVGVGPGQETEIATPDFRSPPGAHRYRDVSGEDLAGNETSLLGDDPFFSCPVEAKSGCGPSRHLTIAH